MKKDEFVHIRKELGKTQKQMAELLGTSLKAVHSYEQGWRRIPIHAERQMLFLFAQKREKDENVPASSVGSLTGPSVRGPFNRIGAKRLRCAEHVRSLRLC